jgi:ribonuclease BN (tRNA processing enzyme)
MLGKTIKIGKVKVTARRLIHPNGVLGYRIEDKGKIFTFATDCEHPSDGSIDKNILELARNADILVYDAQYTPEEYDPGRFGKNGPTKIGWGHSTPNEGIRIAREAGAKKLYLTHHDPLHNDDFIRQMEAEARKDFPETYAAYEGLILEL